MFKRFISAALIIALTNLIGVVTTFANSDAEKEARLAVKVKDGIHKLGTGEAARVRLKLKDKTEIEGYVSQSNEDSFTVVDSATGQATDITYPQVRKIRGNNLSTKTKIAIGIGIAAIVIGVILAANSKLSCQYCP